MKCLAVFLALVAVTQADYMNVVFNNGGKQDASAPTPTPFQTFVASLVRGAIQHTMQEADLLAHSQDWGKTVTVVPGIIVWPINTAQVVTVVNSARAAGLRLQVQGARASQTGQSLGEAGGIILSTARLVGGITWDSGSSTWTALAGNSWAQVVETLNPLGAMPLDVVDGAPWMSVGGTLSAASRGSFSLTVGAVSNKNIVLELTVVTANGQTWKTSETENTELFNLVRGGMGAFGIITEVKCRGRSNENQLARYIATYGDQANLAADLQELVANVPTGVVGINPVWMPNDPQAVAAYYTDASAPAVAAMQTEIGQPINVVPVLGFLDILVEVPPNGAAPAEADIFPQNNNYLATASPTHANTDNQIPLVSLATYQLRLINNAALPIPWIATAGFFPLKDANTLYPAATLQKLILDLEPFNLLIGFALTRTFPVGHNFADDGFTAIPVRTSPEPIIYFETIQGFGLGTTPSHVGAALAASAATQDSWWETYGAPRSIGFFSTYPWIPEDGGWAGTQYGSMWRQFANGARRYDANRMFAAGMRFFRPKH